MNILVSMHENIRKIFFDSDVYNSLEALGKVSYNDTGRNYEPEEMKTALRDKDVVITGWGQTKITHEIAGGRLKLVAHTGGSVGPIVDGSLYDLGVKVVSGNEIFACSVAEGVMAYILCELRNLNTYSNSLKNGFWTPNGQLKTRSLKGRTVGIISLGKISSYLLDFLKPYNVKIKLYSTRPCEEKRKQYGFDYASLKEIFSSCDIVSVHTAANDETYHMIDEKLLKLLKPGSIFINTSRGSVVDEEALIRQLEQERFSAVLDVYEKEPLSQDSKLLKLPNVTLYPHMAGPAADLKNFITSEMVKEIYNFINGIALNYEIPKEIYMGMTQTR